MKSLLIFAISLVVAVSLVTSSQSVEKPTVKKLIEQLGSDSFEEREEASRILIDHQDALPELRRALSSPDPEVRRRARDIIGEIEFGPANRAHTKATSLLESGDVDQAIERFVRWADADSDGTTLEILTRFAGKLDKWQLEKFGKTKITYLEGPHTGDFGTYVNTYHPTFLHSRLPLLYKDSSSFFVLRAAGITVTSSGGGLIVSSGDVVISSSCIHPSAIFSNGSVTINGDLVRSTIICDGDVTVKGEGGIVKDCVIIASGNVTLQLEPFRSAVLAGGTIKQIHRLSNSTSIIREKETNPLGLVKFFDPASVGIEVVAAKDGVEVKTIAKGKAFATAGLETGDVLTAIAGKPITSPETFRRLLRATLAEGTPFSIAARRSEKRLEVRVANRD